MVVLKLRKPKYAPYRGPVLEIVDRQTFEAFLITRRVTFGFPLVSTAPSCNAVQNIMWGNSGLDIRQSTRLKDLLLSHNNHVFSFLPSAVKEDPAVSKSLNNLGSGCNKTQKEAIEDSHCKISLFTPLTGPPGTGKTTVSVKIVLFAYDQGQATLVVSASNYGLDEVARRLSEVKKKDSVYRLYTDLNESENQPATDELPVDEHAIPHPSLTTVLNHITPELTDADVTLDLIQSLADSLKATGSKILLLRLAKTARRP